MLDFTGSAKDLVAEYANPNNMENKQTIVKVIFRDPDHWIDETIHESLLIFIFSQYLVFQFCQATLFHPQEILNHQINQNNECQVFDNAARYENTNNHANYDQ